MRDVLDIAYASDHTYMFFCCVSVFSLMQNVPPHKRVRLHLLTDESFCREDECLLQFLRERFANLEILLSPVSEQAFEERDFKGSLWSKAACYRLILPDLLPDVELCLYMDSDTLVVGDLTPLWETDMTGYCLAGVFEDIAPVRSHTLGNRIPGISNYVNSGVLLMNLALMRRMDIQNRLLQGISDYLVVDQDLLNVICYDSIRLLPPEYNCIPGVHVERPKILHFLMRDYIRPWKNRRARGSEAWWRLAEEFRALYDLEQLRREADWYQRGSILAMFRRCADFDRVYVVGSGSDADRIARALRLGKCRGLKGTLLEDGSVDSVAGTLLIVASRKKKIPVLDRFFAEGGSQEQLFFFERRPVSYYNLVSSSCRREVYGELLMWEFGVDARGVASLPALLEINAARYPDQEALIFQDAGSRRSVSWRALNKMANRLANRLISRKTPRGAAVEVPARFPADPEGMAVILGIIKSGCAVCPADESIQPVNVIKADVLKMIEADISNAIKADVSVPGSEWISDQAPAAEALPDETALILDGMSLTNRQLCDGAEGVRRRIGWHEGDRLLICHEASSGDWLERLLRELAAAMAPGRGTVILSKAQPGEIWELAKEEKATLLSLDDAVLDGVMKDLEKRSVQTPGCAVDTSAVRMILTSSDISAKWQKLIPHIPFNGQGFDGMFRYDSEWYV